MLTLQNRVIGPGTLAELGGILAAMNPRAAMLVTAGQSYMNSGARAVVEPALAGLAVTRLNNVTANPRLADIARGVSLWRAERPGMIVAVGGGSVLDTAKLIGVLGPGTGSAEDVANLCRARDLDSVPVIAIPTTSGSGAEATRFAVFYQAGVKKSVSHPRLRPNHAIIDSLLSASMPPALAAASGLDALAQAVESLWAVGATPDSEALAEAALGQILPCIGGIVRAPTPGLRERMALGANLAGQAIDLSRTTAAHALSYALTADLGVPHGHAVAMLLPYILRINARPGERSIRHPRGVTYLSQSMDRVVRLLGCRDSEGAARFLEHATANLGLATHVTTLAPGVSAACLAAKIDAERLSNNPVALTRQDALDVYARLIGGGARA